jgi:outer membrane receptor protein involved in Fe transport
LESDDGDNFVNLTTGVEKTLGDNFSLLAEYDFAFNDNQTDIYGEGSGYLNLGIRWSIGEGFTLGFDMRDLLDNKQWSPSGADRAIKLEYIKSIF